MLRILLYVTSTLLTLLPINVKAVTHVTVHDPSVVIGYSKDGKITGEKTAGATEVYYIFGSHRAFAKSTDLQNWETFTNNINTNYATLFSKDASWASRGVNQGNTSGYDVSGNLWAPDVIWNKQMKKWCMYMSVNGDNYYSSIVLLTAESLDGDWTRIGTVVYSGFVNKTEAQATDFYKVYNGTDLPSRYANGAGKYTLNAIDPCVFYDQSGNLWMTYGSWFGGLYMLRLDASTGLRDYTYTYETTDGTAEGATSDVYLGHKVAGGNGASGEASYIQYINDRYYLFVTYGGLTAAGGYNMRVFSSKDVTGPYTDLAGHSAIYSTSNTNVGNLKTNVGMQLMNYYQWSWLNYGYCAEGHNSAIVDDDGKAFLVYHTRFTNRAEGHEVRVHQIFTAENGGLVAAPFEYCGETLSSTAYSTEDVVGEYKIIYHNYTDYANKECNTEKDITLNSDGSITGAYRGTWSMSADKPYITLKFNRFGEMQGVIIKQQMENTGTEKLCFSVIGSGNIPMWGYKNADASGIESIETDQTGANAPMYNLAGQRVGNDYKGIVIVKGKKYVKK